MYIQYLMQLLCSCYTQEVMYLGSCYMQSHVQVLRNTMLQHAIVACLCSNQRNPMRKASPFLGLCWEILGL